ncbi:heavy metal translocating P-type ATPase [Desulfitobacterium sp.]|uniref:heavy metal translocating P-type ATPase n=1 Tax=Desulfitobacterium sp. TaxID=49981 RepID=UPI002B1FFD42|nr:heavy metal translocating P-type ATPase [Desulfitobacterium sp.]MEA4900811.1 heavy metal translocating P-type ATPase [Desulfitobacterium sp.]
MRENKKESAYPSSEKVKYRIEGEFCANCSAKMERALSDAEGFGETTINYVTKTVYLPPSEVQEAQAIMEKIEPGIKLVELTDGNRAGRVSDGEESENNLAKKLWGIALATVLFVVGLIFAPQWHDTDYHFLEYLFFISAYILVGYEVLAKAIRNILSGAVFDENFLMAIATIGAIAIHQLPEAVGVMLFYAVGEYIQDRAVDRSRHSIQALLDIRPDSANLIHQLQIIKVDPEDVQVGQQIVVRPGEKVPLDGIVINGSSYLDTSALTGESVPRKVEKDETVLAGMINTTGVLTVRVIREYADSSVQKILDLVENASARKAKTEKFITTFARYYTPGVVILALMIALLPPLMGMGSVSHWLYRALTILVISCPCALVISVPLGYFGGIGGASRHGILIKGANYLEALTQLKTVVFDKTGTLTQGVFEVTRVQPAEGFKEEQLLEAAAKAEAHSNHPIAQSIRKKFKGEIESSLIEGYEEISGKGVIAKIDGQDVIAGRKSLLEGRGIERLKEQEEQEGTRVYLAIDGTYAGFIVIADQVREGAQETVQYLNQAGIKTVMLTGDHSSVAQSIAGRLKIQEYHADLLPEDKVFWLEKLLKDQKEGKGKVAFMGDGINDAPVLTRSDIGIAMGGLGSDAAIEAADVVLMEDQPVKLINALEISRFTKKIIWQNIVFALLIKIGFIILGMFGLANMWEAVFADVGVALLAILNATRVRRYTSPGIRFDKISAPTELNLKEVTAK